MRYLVGVVLAMICLSLTNNVRAASEVDQQQLLKNGGIAFWSNVVLAQTFTPTDSGKLEQLYLPLGFNASALAVSSGITSATVHVDVCEWLSNRPGPVLGSVDVDVYYKEVFPGTIDMSEQRIVLEVGRQYAILLSNDLKYGNVTPYRNTGVDCFWDNVYTNGSIWSGYYMNNSFSWLERATADIVFATYMDFEVGTPYGYENNDDYDDDYDGTSNDSDLCPFTMQGAPVDTDGCSIDQLCVCEDAKNHGSHQSCVTKTAIDFMRAGIISSMAAKISVHDAAQSSCGK